MGTLLVRFLSSKKGLAVFLGLLIMASVLAIYYSTLVERVGQPVSLTPSASHVGESTTRAEWYELTKRFETLLLSPAEGKFLYSAFGIALDGNGNVFVTDAGNHRVQKFDRDGRFLAAWGSHGFAIYPYKLNLPMDVATDQSGNVHVVDRENRKVKVYTNEGIFVRSFGTFVQPLGIAVDLSGNVFVTDYAVKKFAQDGTFITEWSLRGPGNCPIPQDVAVDDAGNVYVPNDCRRTIEKYTGDGVFLTEWTFGPLESGDGVGVDVDGAGNVYVAATRYARKFTPNGELLREWKISAIRIAVDSSVEGNGSFYVIRYGFGPNLIFHYDSEGQVLQEWGPEGGTLDVMLPTWPSRVAVDDAGSIYIQEDGNSHRILRFDANGRFSAIVDDPEQAPFYTPADKDGNTYSVTYSVAGAAITKMSKDGRPLREWGSLCTLYGFVSAAQNQEPLPPGTGCIDPDGPGPQELGDGQLLYPTDIVVDSQGSVYVADGLNRRVQKFDSEGRFLAKIPIVNSSGSAVYLAVDGYDNIYAAQNTYDSPAIEGSESFAPFVQKFDSRGNLVAAWGNYCHPEVGFGCIDPDGPTGPLYVGYGQFHGVRGIAVSRDGEGVYVIDSANGIENAVLVFTRSLA